MFTGLWKNRKRLASTEIQIDLSVSFWQAASFETYLARHTNTLTCHFLPWAAGESELCYLSWERGKSQPCERFKTDQECRWMIWVRKHRCNSAFFISSYWDHDGSKDFDPLSVTLQGKHPKIQPPRACCTEYPQGNLKQNQLTAIRDINQSQSSGSILVCLCISCGNTFWWYHFATLQATKWCAFFKLHFMWQWQQQLWQYVALTEIVMTKDNPTLLVLWARSLLLL